MRCRKASPRSPPEAKLSRIWSRERCLGELDSTGMRKSTKNGAAEISTVAPRAWGRGVTSHTWSFPMTKNQSLFPTSHGDSHRPKER